MPQKIGLSEINQHFSHYLNTVEHGDEIIITRRGKPIARLLPVEQKTRLLTSEQMAALSLETQWETDGYTFKRDDIYAGTSKSTRDLAGTCHHNSFKLFDYDVVFIQ